MTGPLAAAFAASAGACVIVGVQQLMVATRLRPRAPHLLLGCAAIAVAGSAVVEFAIHTVVAEPEHIRILMAYDGLFLASAIVSLSWFFWWRNRGPRRWLLKTETVLGICTAVFGFTVGITYSGEVVLRPVQLIWGETFNLLQGDPSPWRMIGDATNLGFLIILIDSLIRLLRQGKRREAGIKAIALACFSLPLLLIIPTDLGYSNLPPLHVFGFLLIIAVMSWDISVSAARVPELSQQILVKERRWNQLVSRARLLIAVLDREGRIVELNPHFAEVLEHDAGTAAGRHYWDYVAPEAREQRRAAFNQAIAGNPTREIEVDAVTASGERKRIAWRNVMLRDSTGEIEGMLSIGADVTELRDTIAERDRAAAELERSYQQLEKLHARLEEENVYLREEILSEQGFEGIIGSSAPFMYVLHKVRQVAASGTTVLIRGETGVGKELIARTIHSEGDRSAGPFVAVNCAALAPTLIESELFGHEKGAFTGADRRRRGRFELADGGTLLLDEISELPTELQAKLLRVLQEGEFERVGGTATIPVDVRVVAATNRDLVAEVKEGRFREDLYYRVSVFPITIPPLRERREDIPLLIEHFVGHFGRRLGKQITEISAELMRRLTAYHWPGNVRELQNVIERAVLTTTGDVLALAEPLVADISPTEAESAGSPSQLLTLDEVERRHITSVLEHCNGKISGAGGAAEILGLHANTLRYRMKKLGVSSKRGRAGRGGEPVTDSSAS